MTRRNDIEARAWSLCNEARELTRLLGDATAADIPAGLVASLFEARDWIDAIILLTEEKTRDAA